MPGFVIPIAAPAETVIENAFDRRHFIAVHGLEQAPRLEIREGENEEIVVSATFGAGGGNPWQQSAASKSAEFGFRAHVFGPSVCVTELDTVQGKHVVVTAATPKAEGGCDVRVSVAASLGPEGVLRDPAMMRSLLRDSRTSIEQDKHIWEGLSRKPVKNFVTPEDELIIRYHRFCDRFLHE
jgi:hypothetical protein